MRTIHADNRFPLALPPDREEFVSLRAEELNAIGGYTCIDEELDPGTGWYPFITVADPGARRRPVRATQHL